MFYAGFTVTVLCTIAILYFINISKLRALSTLTALMILVVIGGPTAVLINKNLINPKRDEALLGLGVKPEEHGIKHVILVTVDTLRADVLSAYGSREVSTPNIDGLAGDGVIFKNAFSSAPWTLPSFSSIMTGLPPGTHMTTTAKSKLPKNFRTIAEFMLESGYYTTAFVRNNFLHPEFNMDQGFIDYHHYPQSNKLVKSFGTALIMVITNHEQKKDVSTQDKTDMSIDWLKNNKDKNFFLWVHYFDPHIPYAPPQEYIADNSNPPERFRMEFKGAGDIRSGHLTLTYEERQWAKKLYDARLDM